jgi:uncharacterized protein YqeY
MAMTSVAANRTAVNATGSTFRHATLKVENVSAHIRTTNMSAASTAPFDSRVGRSILISKTKRAGGYSREATDAADPRRRVPFCDDRRVLDRLRADLRTSMTARNPVAVSALRSALAAIQNAEAVETPTNPTSSSAGPHFGGSRRGLGATEAPRRALGEHDVESILRAQIEERRVAAADYERLGDTERSARLCEEAYVLTVYLPSGSGAQPAGEGSGGVQSARRPKNAR